MDADALKQALKYISSWLSYRYQREDIPGFVVAISHKGKVVFNEAYGHANIERNTELTPEYMLRAGSQSKTFAATAVMQLQEAGKLHIDDCIVDYLPWLMDHDDNRWQAVTIRQLLSHGAGVARDSLEADFWQLDRSFPGDQEIKQQVLTSHLVFNPGEKLKYSNLGYALLGLLVGVVTGMPFNKYVRGHVIDPLKLNATTPDYDATLIPKLATGYMRHEHRKLMPIENSDTKAMSPSTGLCTTAMELCSFYTALMIGSGKLLGDGPKEDMQRIHYQAVIPGADVDIGYGLGMNIEMLDGHKIIGHNGGIAGHTSRTMADTDSGLAITIMANCINVPAIQITKGIYSVIKYFQGNESPSKPESRLSTLAGRYESLWGVCDVVVTGDKIVWAYPDTWQPLSSPQGLERINDTTFKLIRPNSFGLEGELLTFAMSQDKVTSVKIGGQTSWPEAVWAEKQRSRKVIG